MPHSTRAQVVLVQVTGGICAKLLLLGSVAGIMTREDGRKRLGNCPALCVCTNGRVYTREAAMGDQQAHLVGKGTKVCWTLFVNLFPTNSIIICKVNEGGNKKEREK